jgi:hypothetical protein
VDAAFQVGEQILLRSAGTPEHPQFTESAPDRHTISWAAGLAGILPFFRQLGEL